MKKGWKKSGVIVGLMLLSAVVGSGSAAYGKSENILASLIKEAGAASDESSVFDTLSMQSVADVLKEEGYSAESFPQTGKRPFSGRWTDTAVISFLMMKATAFSSIFAFQEHPLPWKRLMSGIKPSVFPAPIWMTKAIPVWNWIWILQAASPGADL